MEQSDQTAELFTAFSAFQAAVRDPYKGGKNNQFHSQYVSLPDVWDAIRPELPKHGLCVVQAPCTGPDGTIGMTTQVCHSSGQWLRSTFYLPADRHKSRNDVQAAGSTLSYLRRYSLLGTLGLAETDDDAQSVPKTPDEPPEPPWKVMCREFLTGPYAEHIGKAPNRDLVTGICREWAGTDWKGLTEKGAVTIVEGLTAEMGVV